MKKKFTIEWVSILIIFVFAFNAMIEIIYYVKDKTMWGLIKYIAYCIFLGVYIIVLIVADKYKPKKYCIVYDDYYVVNGINIITEAKLVSTKKTNKYKKYGIDANIEKKYIYSNGKNLIQFKLVELDKCRKLIIISKSNLEIENLYAILDKDKKNMVHQYYLSHDIEPFDGENVFVMNKRNISQIKKSDGKYFVLRYRHYVPIEIHALKYVNKYKVGWEYIGHLYGDVEYFESYEKAKESILHSK